MSRTLLIGLNLFLLGYNSIFLKSCFFTLANFRLCDHHDGYKIQIKLCQFKKFKVMYPSSLNLVKDSAIATDFGADFATMVVCDELYQRVVWISFLKIYESLILACLPVQCISWCYVLLCFDRLLPITDYMYMYYTLAICSELRLRPFAV